MSRLNCILIGLFLVVGLSLQGRGQEKSAVSIKDVVIDSVDVQPEYTGGEQARMKFLQDNIVYPRGAMEAGIDGRVIVRFIVEPDGSITNIEVYKSAHELLDEEVVRLMKLMPNWKPGLVNGQPVRSRFAMPVEFKLQNTHKNSKKQNRKK